MRIHDVLCYFRTISVPSNNAFGELQVSLNSKFIYLYYFQCLSSNLASESISTLLKRNMAGPYIPVLFSSFPHSLQC